MAFKLVLQIVDDHDVLMMVSKPLDKRLQRRFTKEEQEIALMEAENALSDFAKPASKKSKVAIGGTV